MFASVYASPRVSELHLWSKVKLGSVKSTRKCVVTINAASAETAVWV
jgi:hypothetical protein